MTLRVSSRGLPNGGVTLNPRDTNWERGLEGDLPDCRLKPLDRDKAKFRYGNEFLDVVFCAQCGEPNGATWPDCPHVYYLCEKCAQAYRAPPGSAKVGPHGGVMLKAPNLAAALAVKSLIFVDARCVVEVPTSDVQALLLVGFVGWQGEYHPAV